MKSKKSSTWEEMIYRPDLPEGWSVETQQVNSQKSTISFIRWGKIHHQGQPQKIYIVFVENNMNYRIPHSSNFVVRGGRHSKPDEDVHYFNTLKSAEKYLLYAMNCTDMWLDDVNSKKTKEAYEKKIADSVRKEENRMKR